jgi:hypothetical protein
VFDDLGGLFYESVVSAYDAYAESRDGAKTGRNILLRNAVEAATALFHFREHLSPELSRTRPEVVLECPDYRLLADVANVAKHKVLTRQTSEGASLVSSAEDISELLVVTSYEDEAGEYSDARVQVTVKCSDGSSRNLDSAIVSVLNYWSGALSAAGAVSYPPRKAMEEPGSRFIPRAEARSPNFEILNSVRWTTLMQLRKFNAKEGRSDPVDLTGKNIEFNIYAPSYVLNMTVTPSGAPPVTCALELTKEQSVAYDILTTDNERNDFLRRLVDERQTELQSKLSSALQERASEPKIEA